MTTSPLVAISTLENMESDTSQRFTLFSKLAPELRDMIWGFALPGPRIVAVHLAPRSRISSQNTIRCKADVNPISTELLHTCSRSRQIALARYEPAFKGPMRHPIYCDWERDTLYINGRVSLIAFTSVLNQYPTISAHTRAIEASKIQHIAVGPVTMQNFSLEGVVKRLSAFTKLSTITWAWLARRVISSPLSVQIVAEMQIRKRVKAVWKEKLQVADEAALPKMEFITEEEMNTRIDG
ncbi:hypothetical protein N431DRAFT_454718 [Stipitochalara longipes BDJ]|nr:hypothetical protein N431DRAFT_454718 [Stipitochalara longipes BDJ]